MKAPPVMPGAGGLPPPNPNLRMCPDCNSLISKSASHCLHCGRKLKKEMGCCGIAGLLFLLLLFGLALVEIIQPPPPKQTPEEKALARIDPKKEAASLVHIDDWRWYKDGFGSIMEADFTIRNDSDHDIKDVVIQCFHYAKSGTRIDSNTRTIYEVVPAHDVLEVKKFNMGFIHSQTASSVATIKDFTLE